MKRILLMVALLASSGIAVAQQGNFKADSQINVTTFFITASNAAITISNRASTLYGVEIFNANGATPIWLKLYNATSVVCGNANLTPTARYWVPSSSNTIAPIVNGDAYVNGILACTVNGLENASSDVPTLGKGSVNIHWDSGLR